MAIQLYYPDRKAMENSYRRLSKIVIVTDDPAVRALWESACQIKRSINELDVLRNRGLAKALSCAKSKCYDLTLPEMREMLLCLEDKALTEEQRDSVVMEARELLKVFEGAKKAFEGNYYPVVKQIRDRCYSLSQSHLADDLIQVFALKRKQLDDLAIWSQDVLAPLLKDLQGQLKSIDASIDEIVDKNVFDKIREMLPDQSNLAELVKQLSKVTPSKDSDAETKKPDGKDSDADTEMPDEKTADTDSQSTENGKEIDTKNADEETKKLVEQTTTPKISAIPVVSLNSALSSGVGAAISSAAPEEAALKLAYEAVQNGLKFLSETTNLYKMITAREKLRKKVDELQEKYDRAMEQYQKVAQEMKNLDRLQDFLKEASAYHQEMEQMAATLTAFANGLSNAKKHRICYVMVFQYLKRYLERLDLIWR